MNHVYLSCRENNLSDVITIIKGRVEDIDLPVEKVSKYALSLNAILEGNSYSYDPTKSHGWTKRQRLFEEP